MFSVQGCLQIRDLVIHSEFFSDFIHFITDLHKQNTSTAGSMCHCDVSWSTGFLFSMPYDVPLRHNIEIGPGAIQPAGRLLLLIYWV
jgi:hypothetical protein